MKFKEIVLKIMKREEVVKIFRDEGIDKAAELYKTQKEDLKIIADYEGAANLVYEYEHNGRPLILRLSFNGERTPDQIHAELHFVKYLARHVVRVSTPVTSRNGNLVETIEAKGIQFHVASFIKGKGIRVPDNGYRYRAEAPIEEYFQNWGQVLGKMHAVTKHYQPPDERIKRPGWFDLHKKRFEIRNHLPEKLQIVSQRIQNLLEEIGSLPKDPDYFGLIHGDFNDGNFTVDYSNGDITVFDFDDSCYFWFICELASAWEGGIGRAMFSGLDERIAFMDRYMDQVFEGYNRENSLSSDLINRLPLFIRLIQIEEFLHYAQNIENPNEEIQAGLNYKIKCIEDEIPYMGFFDEIYSPEKPFSL